MPKRNPFANIKRRKKQKLNIVRIAPDGTELSGPVKTTMTAGKTTDLNIVKVAPTGAAEALATEKLIGKGDAVVLQDYDPLHRHEKIGVVLDPDYVPKDRPKPLVERDRMVLVLTGAGLEVWPRSRTLRKAEYNSGN